MLLPLMEVVAWEPCRRVGGTHCTHSVPAGRAHPFQFESTVWGVNRFVSLRLDFLLSSASFWGQEWSLLCLDPWVANLCLTSMFP